jgi:hypothetical protein
MAASNRSVRFALYVLPDGRGGFGEQTALCRDVLRMANERAIDAFVLTPGFSREADHVWGYRLTPAGVLAPGACPWPDVVWQRVCCRPRALSAQMAHDEAALRGARLFALHRRFSDKWRLHEFLMSLPDLSGHIPATRLLKRPVDLFEMLARHGAVYVKPRCGTQGRGVARVAAVATAAGVRYELRRGERVTVVREALLRDWAAHKRPARHVVQAAISGVSSVTKQQVCDARFLLQFDEQGQPVCTATVGRIGTRGAIASNLHAGGQAVSEGALCQWLSDGSEVDGRTAVAWARRLCERVFTAVVEAGAGDLCELGIDIAYDREARPFVLELNGCPGRRMLRCTDPALRRLSLVRVLEYADRVGRSPTQRDARYREGTFYGGS